MRTLRQKVVFFALSSRVCIVFLQAVANCLVPDHDAKDVFIRPTKILSTKSLDGIVDFFLGGFERWDAHYFLHIAENGYVYENTVAFFPLFPLLLRFTSGILGICLRGLMNDRSLILMSSIILNTVCFAKSADVLHTLSLFVLKDKSLAYKAALLFCVNPASIFFSAPYSETVFSLLCFAGMCSSYEENFSKYCALPFGLAAATRSNGILNLGFILYNNIKNLLLVKWPSLLRKKHFIDRIMLPFKFASSFSVTIQTCIITLGPFVAYQLHCYQLFCTPVHLNLPETVEEYGTKNGLVMPSKEIKLRTFHHWCNSSLPLSYSYVQSHYWNVGFLRYYEWKQLPNFILAAPLIILIIGQSFIYFKQHMDLFLCLGIKFKVQSIKKMREDNTMSPGMFVFVVHALFLVIFCIFFVHIQVTTRILCSASPVPYWYAAYLLSKKHHTTSKRNLPKHTGMEKVKVQIKKMSSVYDKLDANDTEIVSESESNMQSCWKVIIITDIPSTKIGKTILCYFVCYAVMGTVLFTNFYPWT